ncbi:MAG TPA: hypothetical protein VH353_02370 [Caulobacteraceae bacterium]|jgi:hypothetical protein|nr:hypothetical protein [Caulobacteraceae bacterium]
MTMLTLRMTAKPGYWLAMLPSFIVLPVRRLVASTPGRRPR